MLLYVSLGFLAGATLLHFFTAWPPTGVFPVSLVSMTIVSLLIVLLIVWKTERDLYKNISIFILFVCLGWGWTYYQALQKLSETPPLSLGKPVVLSGWIKGIALSDEDKTQFDLQISLKSDWKIRCHLQHKDTALSEGDEIKLLAVLSQPWGMANPGGMDFQKQAFIENIAAMGKVKHILQITHSKKRNIAKFRQVWSDKIANALGDKPLMGVIQAMTVGVRHRISTEEWKVFQATGTSHVVAISGLHIGLIAGFFAKIIGWCVRRSYYLTSLRPTSEWEAMAAIIGALFYSAAAGFSIPTQRACIMIIVGMTARLYRKRVLSWQTLAIALILILIIDPFAPLQMGFWLSFGCVAVLILGQTHYLSSDKWQKWLMPQWVVFIGLIPLSALFFQTIPLVSPLANFIFLPLVSFIIVPCSLLGTIGVPGGLWIAHQTLQIIWPILSYLASFEFNLLYLLPPSKIAIGLGLCGIFLLLLPKGVPAKQVGWLGLLPIFFPKNEVLSEGMFRLTLLDVGQGLSAVIETKDHTLVYDTGPSDRVVTSFLKYSHHTTIDKIIISHTDLDHRGGLEGLMDFSKGRIYTSEPDRLAFPSLLCQSGEKWTWNGVEFQFLHPQKALKKRNDRSCVLKVGTQQKSVLLTGDIEAKAEHAMIKQFGEALKSQVLIVPHHGSLTSSSLAFIHAVSPEYALFPVGKENRYHFPRLEIVERYELRGIKTHLSWQTGAIIFTFDEAEPLTPPIYWRDTFNHYWNQNTRSG